MSDSLKYHFKCLNLNFSEVRLSQAVTFIFLTHLFSLMVGLTHFDVCNQITARASIQDVWDGHDQVIQ